MRRRRAPLVRRVRELGRDDAGEYVRNVVQVRTTEWMKGWKLPLGRKIPVYDYRDQGPSQH